MTKHVVYKRETAFGTWVTPDVWLPVEEANIKSEREFIRQRLTGSGRDFRQTIQGAKPVSGPIVVPWHVTGIGALLAGFMRSVTTTTPDTGIYVHSLLFDDAQGMLPFSIQQQYSSAVAVNVLSALITSLSIQAKAKERLMLNLDFAAKDEALAGGTWDHDGGASPAVIGSPSYPSVQRPFMFYDATLTMGGTASIASNIISIAAGTDYPKFGSAEIKIDLGLDTDGFGLTSDPTVQELCPGDRAIELSLDRSWCDLLTTFYANWRSGTPMPFELAFVGPVITGAYRYEAHIVVPSLVLDPAALPELSGSYSKKTQSIGAVAQQCQTTGHAINIWIQTSEATL